MQNDLKESKIIKERKQKTNNEKIIWKTKMVEKLNKKL